MPAKIAVKTKGGAKALRLVLVAEFTVDPSNEAFNEVRRAIPELEAVASIEEEQHADGEGQEETTLQIPGHRLGGGNHTVRIWNLPPVSRMPEAVPLLELGMAAFDRWIRAVLDGGMPRLKIEIVTRMALLVDVSCPDLATLHNADLWLDAIEHQPALDDGDAVAPKKRKKGDGKKKDRQANLFEPATPEETTTPAATKPEPPTYDVAVALWNAGSTGRILVTEEGDEPFEASGPSRELLLEPMAEDAEVRVAYGDLGGLTRWWVIGRMEFSGKLGWWAQPVPETEAETADPEELQDYTPPPPESFEAVRLWIEGDPATRPLVHANASISLEDVVRAARLKLDGEADTPEGRVLGIAYGAIGSETGWWVVGLMEVGDEAAWYAQAVPDPTLTSPRGDLDGLAPPNDLPVAHAREKQPAEALVLEGDNGDGVPDPDVPGWKPSNKPSLRMLRNAAPDDDGFDALDRYVAALSPDQMKAQLAALGGSSRATSRSRLTSLLTEAVMAPD